MKKVKVITLSLLAVFLISAVTVFLIFKGQEFTIHLDKETLQTAINKKMPFEKKFLLVCKLTVMNTTVLLQEGSRRIGATTNVELSLNVGKNPKVLTGSTTADAGLQYDQETSTFYLQQPFIRDLKIAGIPEKYITSVSAKSQEILQDYLNKVPVYRVKDDNMKMKLAKAVIKNIQVLDGTVAVTLGY